MDFPTEAAIVAEFHKVLMSGQLYRGSKPVMWSPVERTAWPTPRSSTTRTIPPTIWVKFPVVTRATWPRACNEVGAEPERSGRPSRVGAAS
jgi:isoleucyl-tRNA synthetase